MPGKGPWRTQSDRRTFGCEARTNLFGQFSHPLGQTGDESGNLSLLRQALKKLGGNVGRQLTGVVGGSSGLGLAGTGDLGHGVGVHELRIRGVVVGVCDNRETRALFYETIETAIVPGLEAVGLAANDAWENRRIAA